MLSCICIHLEMHRGPAVLQPLARPLIYKRAYRPVWPRGRPHSMQTCQKSACSKHLSAKPALCFQNFRSHRQLCNVQGNKKSLSVYQCIPPLTALHSVKCYELRLYDRSLNNLQLLKLSSYQDNILEVANLPTSIRTVTS